MDRGSTHRIDTRCGAGNEHLLEIEPVAGDRPDAAAFVLGLVRLVKRRNASRPASVGKHKGVPGFGMSSQVLSDSPRLDERLGGVCEEAQRSLRRPTGPTRQARIGNRQFSNGMSPISQRANGKIEIGREVLPTANDDQIP